MTRRAVPVDAAEQWFRDAEWDAYPRWQRGELVPARITLLLDARALYGPDVDRACGAAEPAVDEWEAGTRYPTWPQLIGLARLCDATPTWFFGPVPERGPVFLCARPASRSRVIVPPPVIARYPEEVWRPVVAGERDDGALFDLEPHGPLSPPRGVQ